MAKAAGMPVADVQRLDSVQSEPKEVEKFFAEGLLNKSKEVQYEDQHSLEAKWRRPKRQAGLPAKLTDYILEWPKAGHLGTKADAQAAHTCTKAETKAASRAHAATSRPAAAWHRLQFNRACVLHGDARK